MGDAESTLHLASFGVSSLGLFLSLLFLALSLFLLSRKGQTLKVPSLNPLVRQGNGAFSLSRIPLLLFIATLGFLLLDPMWIEKSHSFRPLPTQGKSWTLLIDRSGSMWRTLPLPDGDIKPLVKYVTDIFEEQIKGRDNDLVALVAFARKPDILLPLTPERARFRSLLNDLQKVPPEEDGTAITYSLYKSLLMIQGAKEKEKTFALNRNVLILVTDGFETIPEEDARDPLRGVSIDKVLVLAKKLGVHIYVVSLFPSSDNLRYGPEIRRLQQIGRSTDGGFFQATPEGLGDLFKQIDSLEGGAPTIAPPASPHGIPLAPYIVYAALGVLLLYFLIREVAYLTLP